MPKSKRCVISCLTKKELALYSSSEGGNLYTVAGNKINISKLRLIKNQNYLTNELINSDSIKSAPLLDSVFNSKYKKYEVEKYVEKKLLKRKYGETEDNAEKPGSSSNFEQYQSLNPYTVQTYSGILTSITPNLLVKRNGCTSPVDLNSSLLNCDSCPRKCQDSVKHCSNMPLTSETEAAKDINAVPIEGMSFITTSSDKLINISTSSMLKSGSSSNIEQYQSLNPYTVQTYSGISSVIVPNLSVKKNGSTSPVDFNSSLLNCDSHTRECQDSIKHCSNMPFTTETKAIEDGSTVPVEDMSFFTTAAGKLINVSTLSVLKAEQLITKDFSSENLPKAVLCNPDKDKRRFSKAINYIALKDTSLPKTSENKFTLSAKTISNEMMPKSKEKCIRLESPDLVEDVNFSTAAGKAINISSTAMKRAEKLIEGAFDKENEPLSSKSMNLHPETRKICKNMNAFKDIGHSSKAFMDIDMDKTLVEKIFEDTTFDEKEFELTMDSKKTDNFTVVLESETDKNTPTRKLRKSLGGRRSMRYCLDKF